MPEIKSNYPKIALSLLIFGHFLNHFYAYIFGASLFVIRQDIPITNSQIGLLATVQLSLFAVLTFVVGIFGVIWAKSKTLFVPLGVVMMAVHLFTASIAQDYSLLIVSAVIVGIGASLYHPIAYASIADLFETKKGIAMALNAALGMIGTALTPAMIVTFDLWVGWRNFYIIFGIAGLIIGLVLFFGFSKTIECNYTSLELENNHLRKGTRKRTKAKEWMTRELVIILTFTVGICLLYSSFRSGLYKIITQFLSIIFVDYYAIDVFEAGWISSVMLVVGGLTAIFGGLLSDKYPTSLTMLISLLGSAIALFAIFLLGTTISWIITLILFFSFVAFLHFSSAAATKYVAEVVPKESRSTALGFLFAIPNTVAGIFPWIFGLILDESTFENAIAYLFLLAALAVIMALYLLMVDIKRKKQKIILKEC